MKDDVPNIVLLNKTSHFEEIKLIDDDGIKYWLARDLMPVLGYRQWRQFNDAILRAIASCKNIGNDCEKNFLRSIAKSSGGRPREDFRLSRYGAYLTAMNGDSRKPEIVAAQSYFAYKTREAELTSFSQQSFCDLVVRVERQD
jgi:DNA-damage-inducible protein D